MEENEEVIADLYFTLGADGKFRKVIIPRNGEWGFKYYGYAKDFKSNNPSLEMNAEELVNHVGSDEFSYSDELNDEGWYEPSEKIQKWFKQGVFEK